MAGAGAMVDTGVVADIGAAATLVGVASSARGVGSRDVAMPGVAMRDVAMLGAVMLAVDTTAAQCAAAAGITVVGASMAAEVTVVADTAVADTANAFVVGATITAGSLGLPAVFLLLFGQRRRVKRSSTILADPYLADPNPKSDPISRSWWRPALESFAVPSKWETNWKQPRCAREVGSRC
jgi:hypothetical protein